MDGFSGSEAEVSHDDWPGIIKPEFLIFLILIIVFQMSLFAYMIHDDYDDG